MKLNKKGFAVSGMLYSILILFLVLIVGVLSLLVSRKVTLDKIKNEVVEELGESNIRYTVDSYIKDGMAIWYDTIENKKMIDNGDITNTSLFDFSGNNRNGTLQGFDFTETSGWSDDHLKFDGVNDYVNTGVYAADFFTSASDFTISTLVKINSVSSVGNVNQNGDVSTIIGATNFNGYGIVWRTNQGQVNGYGLQSFFRTDLGSRFNYTDQTLLKDFFHLVQVYSKSQNKHYFYINGIRVSETQAIDGIFNRAVEMGNIRIGLSSSTSGNPRSVSTHMDFYNAQIYNRALSELEIKHNYSVDSYRYINPPVIPDNYDDHGIPSVPELSNGMIPVVYSEATNSWLKADIEQTWYDYEIKQWANAVLVTDDIRDYYLESSPNTVVRESDILAHLVWIPRYRYQLFNVGTQTVPFTTINVRFEDSVYPKSTGMMDSHWLTHPAFRMNGKELSGIWVGKFETTGNVVMPTVLPNVQSLRNQNINTQYQTAMKFSNHTTYGIDAVLYDAHMMKNTEWGAITYLSQSTYGKNSEVWINNSETFVTGCAGSGINGPGYGALSCQFDYTSENGQEASTTGNVYGVYDMSGGSWEYLMGNNNNVIGQSGFSIMPSIEYYNFYEDGTVHDGERRILGDATTETRDWYGDHSNLVTSEFPWFRRGGSAPDGSGAGIFSYYLDSGQAYPSVGFRITVVKK